MTQAQKALDFAKLHVPGQPLVLYNIWDAGGAKVVAKAGTKAVATGSWSVAAAQGYADGQKLPIDVLLQIVARITETVDLPVTVDFEGCYAEAPDGVAANVTRVIEVGAIGINFEDQIVGGEGLHLMEAQSGRISAARRAAEVTGVPLFINARTDLFLKEKDGSKHDGLVAEAKERATAYAEAGASGFFVPGLTDPALIRSVCEAISLPVNCMMKEGAPSVAEMGTLGVARVSYGPGPYFTAMADLAKRFQEVPRGT